jgi:hypothetical protein
MHDTFNFIYPCLYFLLYGVAESFFFFFLNCLHVVWLIQTYLTADHLVSIIRVLPFCLKTTGTFLFFSFPFPSWFFLFFPQIYRGYAKSLISTTNTLLLVISQVSKLIKLLLKLKSRIPSY